MKAQIKSIYRYFFYDKTGKLVLWQFPNAPLIIWLVFRIITFLNILPAYNSVFKQISIGFFCVWAYLELTQGVNNFRKLLGLLVLTFLILSSS